MDKTMTTRGRRAIRGRTVVMALAALLVLAPAIEAAGLSFYTTSWGSFPFVWHGWATTWRGSGVRRQPRSRSLRRLQPRRLPQPQRPAATSRRPPSGKPWS
ncbi:MAG: hypothetical protein QME79_10990 [Bacillota bacterium]|nr:hypothetical protein [Bacillota bacterium]